MKSKAFLTRVLAILLLLLFFALVFSAITLGTHHHDHTSDCSVCAYYDEHRNELFIPILIACAVILSIPLPYAFSRLLTWGAALFTPVKLKVKLSD